MIGDLRRPGKIVNIGDSHIDFEYQNESGNGSGSENESDSEDLTETIQIRLNQFERKITRGQRKPITESTLQEVRVAVWLTKSEIREWLPLDQPLKFHFERHSTLYQQMNSVLEARPQRHQPEDFFRMGWKKIDPNEQVTTSNIKIDFGKGCTD